MALYYFDVCEGDLISEDGEGVELADLDTARRAAALSAIELTYHDLRRGAVAGGRSFRVRDAGGAIVFTAPLFG